MSTTCFHFNSSLVSPDQQYQSTEVNETKLVIHYEGNWTNNHIQIWHQLPLTMKEKSAIQVYLENNVHTANTLAGKHLETHTHESTALLGPSKWLITIHMYMQLYEKCRRKTTWLAVATRTTLTKNNAENMIHKDPSGGTRKHSFTHDLPLWFLNNIFTFTISYGP